MGDIHLRNAPFVVTVPDNWNIVTIPLDMFDLVYGVSPTQNTTINYLAMKAATIEEARASMTCPPYYSHYYQVQNEFDLVINDMPARLIYAKLIEYPCPLFYIEISSLKDTDIFQKIPPPPTYNFNLVTVYIAYKGHVLYVGIGSLLGDQGIELDVAYNYIWSLLYGIWPASTSSILENLPFDYPANSDLLNKIYSELGEKIDHLGQRFKVNTLRSTPFGEIPESLILKNKVYLLLNTIDELIVLLGNDLQYSETKSELKEIRKHIYRLFASTLEK